MSKYRIAVQRRRDHLYVSILILIVAAIELYRLIICFNRYARNTTEPRIADRKPPSSRNVFRCTDKDHEYKITQKGQFWVLSNYIPAERWFACNESVTFTTTADFTFFDNLEPLVQRWRAPVSLAVYAPGTDFQLAVQSMLYARSCHTNMIRQYVSFHVFFEDDHMPEIIPRPGDIFDYDATEKCTSSPRWQNVNATNLYKSQQKLNFPINVGRNIARDAATTHFILAADIELYPSADLVPDFLRMITRNHTSSSSPHQVYVLPPFEIAANLTPPAKKEQLVSMLKNRTAKSFHQSVCPVCHRIPQLIPWIQAEITQTLQIFYTTKRGNKFWEPFYIGTNQEPWFDERLSWEGRFDKMTQAYAMCVLDYDYHILNNAFLIHKPGFRKVDNSYLRAVAASKNIRTIKRKSMTEIHKFFNTNSSCSIIGKSKDVSLVNGTVR